MKYTLKELLLAYVQYCLPQDKYKISYEKITSLCIKYLGNKYSLGTLRKEISILKSENLISSKLRYRKKVPILSVDGFLEIAPALPKMKQEPWDGKWRIVVTSIPTVDRDLYRKLEQRLFELNFKKVFRGTYISPHSNLSIIHRYATLLGVRQYIMLFVTDKIEQEKTTIQRIWKLDNINNNYRKFIVLARRELNKKVSWDWPIKAKTLEKKFIKIYATDPNMPDELLPTTWHAPKALEYFRKITNSY